MDLKGMISADAFLNDNKKVIYKYKNIQWLGIPVSLLLIQNLITSLQLYCDNFSGFESSSTLQACRSVTCPALFYAKALHGSVLQRLQIFRASFWISVWLSRVWDPKHISHLFSHLREMWAGSLTALCWSIPVSRIAGQNGSSIHNGSWIVWDFCSPLEIILGCVGSHIIFSFTLIFTEAPLLTLKAKC